MTEELDLQYRAERIAERREKRRRQHRRAERAAGHDCSYCLSEKAVAVRDEDKDYVCAACAETEGINLVTPDSWLLDNRWRVKDGIARPLTITHIPPGDLAEELAAGRERARREQRRV